MTRQMPQSAVPCERPVPPMPPTAMPSAPWTPPRRGRKSGDVRRRGHPQPRRRHPMRKRTAPPTTTPPPETPDTTNGGGGGGGGDFDFPPAVERWRSLAQAYFPSSRVDEALAVLECESLGNADAYNPYSGASGLYQFLPATWASASASAGFSGASAFDGEANIGTAAWLANRYQELGQGFWSPWSCRRVLG